MKVRYIITIKDVMDNTDATNEEAISVLGEMLNQNMTADDLETEAQDLLDDMRQEAHNFNEEHSFADRDPNDVEQDRLSEMRELYRNEY